jgi:hypothetical protein
MFTKVDRLTFNHPTTITTTLTPSRHSVRQQPRHLLVASYSLPIAFYLAVCVLDGEMIAFKFAVWVLHVGHILAGRWQRYVRTQGVVASLLVSIIRRNTHVTFVNEPPHCLSHSLSEQWSLKCHDNQPWRRRQHVSLKRWHLCTNTRYHITRQLPPWGLSICFITSLTSVAVCRLCITAPCQRNLCSCIISDTSETTVALDYTQRFSSYLTKKVCFFYTEQAIISV